MFAVLAIIPQQAFAQGLSVSLTNGRSAMENGLGEPSIGLPEVIDQKRRLITASAGIGQFAFRDRAVMLHSYADVTFGTARKKDIGTRSGDSRSASKFTASPHQLRRLMVAVQRRV